MFSEPHVERSDYDGVTAVRPVGEFDIAVTELLRSVFADAITATSNRLVVDLSATTFLDSLALGTIISAGKRASDLGGWVRLVAPPKNIRKLLRITEIDRVFGLYDTTEQALSHGAGATPAPVVPEEPTASI